MNIGIRTSANSIKMKRVVRPETSVCFRITRLMNDQIRSPKKSYFPKRRESDDKNAVNIVKVYHNWVASRKTRMRWIITIGLRLARLGCVGFSLKVESLGETRGRKSWDQFKGYDSLSLRYVKRVSGKRKDHRLEN